MNIFKLLKQPHFILIVLLMSYSSGHSQTAATCTLNGSVHDSQGSYVPGAEIILSNKDIVRKAKTSEVGEFSLTIAPGIYSVSVTGPKGFETTYRSEIKLEPKSTRTLNVKVYAKVPVFWESSDAHRKGADHPSLQYVNFTYEEIPNLSDSGVRRGMVRFTEKCETQTLRSYNARSFAESASNRSGITFTYDFFTVVADDLHINTKTNEMFALGKLEIENEGESVRYDGIIKISIKAGKATYEKVDTSSMY